MHSDPVHAIRLSTFIADRLRVSREVNASAGPNNLFELAISQVDPLVLNELEGRIAGNLKG